MKIDKCVDNKCVHNTPKRASGCDWYVDCKQCKTSKIEK